MEWYLAGEFELANAPLTKVRVWFRWDENSRQYQAQVTVASFDPSSGTPHFATSGVEVARFKYPYFS